MFLNDRMWNLALALDPSAMHQAGQVLLGIKDFSAFRNAKCQSRSPIRYMNHVSVTSTTFPWPWPMAGTGAGPGAGAGAGAGAGLAFGPGPGPGPGCPIPGPLAGGPNWNPMEMEGLFGVVPVVSMGGEGVIHSNVDLGTTSSSSSSSSSSHQVIRIRLRANAFVYRMVRNIVGSLVGVGTGAISIEDFASILASRDRARCAPAQGLYLVDVHYGGLRVDASVSARRREG